MRHFFGDCVVDTARRELRRDGTLMPLERKGYQVLLYLIEHCDRVVTRDELLAHAWPGVYVVDTTVARCLTLIRRAVGDTGMTQRVIKTLHRHGYRLVAPVVTADDQAAISAPRSVSGETASPPLTPAPSPQAVPATPSLDERRCVTVLSGVLMPALSLLPGVDVETQHTLLGQLDAAVRRAVGPYDGHLLYFASDRLSVVFGAPRAQEDHTERAVLAALALRRQWTDLGATWQEALGTPMELGVGIHTAPVVIRMTNQVALPMSLTGDVLPLAEHLACHAAEMVLISAAAAPMAGAIAQLVVTSPIAVPGRREPLVAYRVTGPTALPRIGTAIDLRHRGHFIGRQGELATLHAHLDRVRAGQGRSVGIVGPPGMGKTRLTAEFLRSLDGGDCMVVYGRCQSHGQHTAYLALMDLLHRWWGIEDTDTAASAIANAKAALQASDLPPDDVGAHLLQLLGPPRDASAAEPLSPQELRTQMFAAFHSLFIHHSERKPVVIVIEDAHWIDATSEEYLTALAQRLAARRLLLLITFRPGYRPPWQAQSVYTQLALAPLVDEDSRSLVRQTTQGSLLQATIETQIVARCQGNPFFLEAFTRALAEQVGPSPAIGVPDTVQSILAARIDRLPTQAKHLLQLASVVGPDLPVRLLRGLAALPDSVFDQALQALQTTELLYEARITPDSVYAFQHSLVQDVAYQSLLRQTRQELHHRAFVLLEIQAAEEGEAASHMVDRDERLAHHALHGELWESVVRYSRRAGMRAFERGSNREAAAALEQAIAANERLLQDRPTVERAIDLRLALRSALLPAGDFARTLACVREAERLAESLGDGQRLAQAAFFLSLHLYLKGQHVEAVDAGRRAQALTAERDPIVHALATYLTGIPLQAQGRYAEAVPCFEQSLAALGGAKRRLFFNLAILPSVTSCAFLAMCCSELGRFARARAHGAEGIEIAEAVGHPPSVMFAAWGAGWVAFRQGDAAGALVLLERALGICREVGLVLHFPMVAVPLGSTYALAGRSDAAVALLTEALERAVAHDMVNFHGVCGFSLAQALLDTGRIDEAVDRATQALGIVRRQWERGFEAYTLHVLGEGARRRGNAEAAMRHAVEGLAVAQALDMPPLQAHCHASIGAAHALQGQSGQARAALAKAVAAYRALDMRTHAQAAESLLARSS